MFKKIRWSFTSDDEKREAERYLGGIANYVIAEDLPRKPMKITKSNIYKEKGELKVEIQNFGLSASEPAEVEVICGGHSLGRMTLKTLQPYEVEYLAFSPDAALADDKSSYEVVFFMKEKRWNGTDSEKTDLICKLTVDNILFLSEKRLPNVSNKKNAKYEEFIDLLSYGMLCGRTGSISDLSRRTADRYAS